MMLQCENRTLKLDSSSHDPCVKPKAHRILDVLGEITNMVSTQELVDAGALAFF
jgi:hypothetical protein